MTMIHDSITLLILKNTIILRVYMCMYRYVYMHIYMYMCVGENEDNGSTEIAWPFIIVK